MGVVLSALAKLLGLPPMVATPWSYSALDAFETCPRNYNATRWANTHKEVYTRAKDQGIDVHTSMQKYVEQGTAPPIALTHFRTAVDLVTDSALKVTCEMKLGLDAGYNPCSYFDRNNICLRTQFDLNVLRPDRSIAQLDYKTSSQPRESDLQLRLYGLAGLMTWTQYTVAYSAFLYTLHDTRKLVTTRADLLPLIQELNPRVERLRIARETDVWPERESWKCRFCPVKECRFWKPTPQKR